MGIYCRMRKVENAQCIVPMALHKVLDPLCSILDGAHFLGSLNATSAHFRAGLISKRRGVGQTRKVRELRRDDLFLVLACAAFDRANRDHLHLRPHSPH